MIFSALAVDFVIRSMLTDLKLYACRAYSGVSNKRVNTDHVHLQNPNSTRAYWIPTRSVSSEARSAEAAKFFLKIQTFGTKSIFITSFQQWNLKIKVVHFIA